MNPEITNWLLESRRLDWKTEFNYMLEELTFETAMKNHSNLSLFIQGLHYEFQEKNPSKALYFYQRGAAKLEPLSLSRLHDVYLGDTTLGTEFDCNKALTFLVFAGIYSQDYFFTGAVVPFKKLKAFINQFDSQCKILQGVLKLTNVKEIDAVKNLTVCLLLNFQGIDKENQRINFLNQMENLPLNIQKEIMFTMYLSEFRLPWEHVVKKKETLVLKLMQQPEIFDLFFENYKGLIQMAAANKDIAMKLRTWIQSILLVIDFAALSPQKNKYYAILMPFVLKAMEKDFFDGQNLIGWLRYFLAYCYEKGICVSRDLGKANELIEQNIRESPEGVNYPLREALLLKQINRPKESEEVIERFENLLQKRIQLQPNSLLYYARAKSYEKYYEDLPEAIKYYKKGASKVLELATEKTFFFYSYWKIKCARKLDKLIPRLKNQTVLRNTSMKVVEKPYEEESSDETPEKMAYSVKSQGEFRTLKKENQVQGSKSYVIFAKEPLVSQRELSGKSGKSGKNSVESPWNDNTTSSPNSGRGSLTYESANKNKGFSVQAVTSPRGEVNGFSTEEKQYQLLEESKKILKEYGVPVFAGEKVKMSSLKANNSMIAVANDRIYHVEEAEIRHLGVLRNNERTLQEAFNSQSARIVAPHGVHLQEKPGKLAMYFLTPLPQTELGGAIDAGMFQDLKTKLHVAMQIALCLMEIHERSSLDYYGALKPHKILLDEYFSVRMYSGKGDILMSGGVNADGYYAPEQLRGRHTQQADIWTFGIIFMELVFGERVVNNQRAVEGFYKGSKVNKNVKGKMLEAQNLVNEMIRLEESSRPSIHEVYEELKRIYLKIHNKAH